MTTDMFSEAIQELIDRTGVGPTFSGGGRGQVATLDVEKWGLLLVGKGSSRYAALVDLLEQVRAALLNMEKARIAADLGPVDGDPGTEGWEEEREHIAGLPELGGMTQEDFDALSPVEQDEVILENTDEGDPDEAEAMGVLPEEKRATVEDALAVLMLVFPDLSVNEEDDDRPPAPVWKDVDGSPVLVGIVPCVGECMQGTSDICDCRCMGANHGLMKVGALGNPTWAEVLALQPIRFGPKACACGCGTQTDRRFAPGHDARFHAAQKREQERASLGMTEGEYVDFLVERGRAKAKARRAARRAKRSAVVMPSEATDA